MKIEVFPDSESVARGAAKLIAEEARLAVEARGKFVMAVSGGKTPWIMLRDLAQEDVPWGAVHTSRWMNELHRRGIPIET
jgi:6-phosphogluconolactonase